MTGDDRSDAAPSRDLLIVEVAGRRWALPAEDVVEIHAAVRLVPLPDAPDVIVGLVNRRGRPLPVLDLRRRLGLEARPVRVDDRLVVVRLPDRDVALLVDAALDVVTVPADAVDQAVATATETLRAHGVVVLPDGLLVILDAAAFLSSTESAALDEAVRQALGADAA